MRDNVQNLVKTKNLLNVLLLDPNYLQPFKKHAGNCHQTIVKNKKFKISLELLKKKKKEKRSSTSNLLIECSWPRLNQNLHFY